MNKFNIDADYLITGVLLALIILAFAGLLYNASEWHKFKLDHNCKQISHISGDIFNTFGVSGNGQVVVGIGSTPDKNGWLCDDGITYYHDQ